ncbi:hypothetical protein ES705_38709 [subsurface metagenome]
MMVDPLAPENPQDRVGSSCQVLLVAAPSDGILRVRIEAPLCKISVTVRELYDEVAEPAELLKLGQQPGPTSPVSHRTILATDRAPLLHAIEYLGEVMYG